MIVATAGHVDHGKTSLVRALTGADTDRLPEEKRRGMSIDLGYAFLRREGSPALAFIDVPGHERFVRNMTAGVHGIDLALLVVAADDGPMPQTREHLEILDLLGAPRLAAVLTKVDRVDAGRAGQAAAEVRALLEGTRFRGAPLLRVSSTTGEGLDSLVAFLSGHDAERRETARRFRMHVDREFVIDGLGLVVTGTALCGSVSAGETVCVVPAGRRARVRSVRANSADADRAAAGERCALALQGLSRGEVRRGDTIVSGEGWPRSRRIDVLFQSLHGQAKPARRATAVSVHLGTAAYPAQLAPLGEGFARLTLAREVSAWHGERFLVRDTGSQRLLGGGAVVDPQPPERGAARPERIAFLRAAAGRPAEAAFRALLDADPGVVDVDWLAGAWHLAEEEVLGLTGAHDVRVFAARGRRCAVSAAAWNVRCAEMLRAIVQWHAEHPDWIGARLDDLRKLLGARWSDASGAVAQALVAEGALGKQGPYYKLPEHRPVLSPADEALWKRVAPLLEGAGGRPPRVHELSGLLTMEPPQVLEILERAARAGLCYRVAPNRFFLPAAVSRLAALAAQLDAASNGEGFSAAQYRDASGLGRNLAIQVLEFLDELGATRRHGELRRALAATILDTEEQRTPVGRPDFKSGERRLAPLASSTPASSATPPQGS